MCVISIFNHISANTYCICAQSGVLTIFNDELIVKLIQYLWWVLQILTDNIQQCSRLNQIGYCLIHDSSSQISTKAYFYQQWLVLWWKVGRRFCCCTTTVPGKTIQTFNSESIISFQYPQSAVFLPPGIAFFFFFLSFLAFLLYFKPVVDNHRNSPTVFRYFGKQFN